MKPEPGIYENIPFNTYLAWEAVSNSRLGLIEQSPLHYKRYVPTASSGYLLGSLAHCGTLEPTSVADRYAVMPLFELDPENCTQKGDPSTSTTTTYYKQKAAAFREANAHKEVVPQASYESMSQIVFALQQDAKTWDLLSGDGHFELSLVWLDPETDILCKARLDRVTNDGRLADLKTTIDIFKFQKSIHSYGYNRQLAHYLMGYSVLKGEYLDPWLAVVESKLPHAVMSAPLGERTLELGERRRAKAMRTLANCLATGEWPGPSAPEVWDVPEWALNELRITETETEVIAV
jgi:hypothetical protein